jgi:hypothetical protein
MSKVQTDCKVSYNFAIKYVFKHKNNFSIIALKKPTLNWQVQN